MSSEDLKVAADMVIKYLNPLYQEGRFESKVIIFSQNVPLIIKTP